MAGGRRLKVYKVPPGKNSLQGWSDIVSPIRIIVNFAVIYLAKYLPFLSVKNWLYRRLGARIGPGVSFALAAVIDVFYPQLITVGDDSIIGYNCTILCHEFLIGEYRTGEVVIGKEVMIGANSTILPGIIIGDRAVIAAGALVSRDVPSDVMVAGVPAGIIKAL
ncbi:MAG: acyltransferase [Peptococcaceae bacterium]|nr:acyltransferase [Peptococcaceae bacterium]